MKKSSIFVLRIFLMLIVPMILGCILAFEFRVVRISDDSMLPTLRDRDLILVRRMNQPYAWPAGRTRTLTRGDIVLVWDKDRYIIKRIGAIGGDIVTRTFDEFILVNGRSITDSGWHKHPKGPLISKVRVPEGYVYLLGDNPAKSSDSRSLGVFTETLIAGRMVASLSSFQF